MSSRRRLDAYHAHDRFLSFYAPDVVVKSRRHGSPCVLLRVRRAATRTLTVRSCSESAQGNQGSGRSSDPDFVGRLTPLTFRESAMRVSSKLRVLGAARRLSRSAVCRSTTCRCRRVAPRPGPTCLLAVHFVEPFVVSRNHASSTLGSGANLRIA